MAQILIRQIEDDILARLKARAKANARSTEAEVREILADAVRPMRRGRSLMSLVGAGKTENSFKSTEEIVAHIRSLRDEWDR